MQVRTCTRTCRRKMWIRTQLVHARLKKKKKFFILIKMTAVLPEAGAVTRLALLVVLLLRSLDFLSVSTSCLPGRPVCLDVLSVWTLSACTSCLSGLCLDFLSVWTLSVWTSCLQGHLQQWASQMSDEPVGDAAA